MRSALDSLLDRSVLFSFDRTGFARHLRSSPQSDERSVAGRQVLITGGTSGIGLAAAEMLCLRGATPVLWARSDVRGRHAAARVGGHFTSVDLGDLRAVARAAHGVEGPELAAVILNAGAMPLQRTMTPQGHELIWASQVLGHLLLLRILRRRGRLTPQTRVVWVSSGGMYLKRLDLRDLRAERRYQRHTVYANAKRAQVLLNQHLAQRWPQLQGAAMHPGWVDTPAVRHSMPLFRALTLPILRDPTQGGDCITWLVSRRDPLPPGAFWFDRARAPLHRNSRTQSLPGDEGRLVDHVFRATQPFLEAP